MKTLTHPELSEIIVDHNRWVWSNGKRGKQADLSDTDLSGFNLYGHHIPDAIMTGAILPTGETWEDFLKISVPKLLTCTGKTIEQIVKAGCWRCYHSWANCPMAYVFGVTSMDDIPPEYKKQVEQFITFYDSYLIPEPDRSQ